VASCLKREGHLRGEESEKKTREREKENVSSL
jgi:hypothetical protein